MVKKKKATKKARVKITFGSKGMTLSRNEKKKTEIQRLREKAFSEHSSMGLQRLG